MPMLFNVTLFIPNVGHHALFQCESFVTRGAVEGDGFRMSSLVFHPRGLGHKPLKIEICSVTFHSVAMLLAKQTGALITDLRTEVASILLVNTLSLVNVLDVAIKALGCAVKLPTLCTLMFLKRIQKHSS